MSKGERSILVSHRVCVDEIMLDFVDLNKIDYVIWLISIEFQRYCFVNEL